MAEKRRFCNPLLPDNAPDPWAVFHGGNYYLTYTIGDRLDVLAAGDLSRIAEGQRVTVWRAPASGPRSAMIWAPELHRIDGRWYLYYTACDGSDANHRHYVLRSASDDPLGSYEDCGRVDPFHEAYAIDGSVLQMPDGMLYFMYCSYEGVRIAPMESPLQTAGPGQVFICADQPWEVARYDRVHGWVEAPQALWHDGQLFVVYSAGHTGTRDYCLGLMRYLGGDPLRSDAWDKHTSPVFSSSPGAYGPGHCSFVRSPDGYEDWIVYHAKPVAERGWLRTARAQPFRWHQDGTPDFGAPVATALPLSVPSGTP